MFKWWYDNKSKRKKTNQTSREKTTTTTNEVLKKSRKKKQKIKFDYEFTCIQNISKESDLGNNEIKPQIEFIEMLYFTLHIGK